MSNKIYQWSIPSFAKGIDPAEAAKELERIQSIYGELTAEAILTEATPKDALFHKLFTWDNNAAAQQYRLSEARRILNNIEVRVITDGQPKQISVYEVVKKPSGERTYKDIESFTPSDVKYIGERTLKEVNHLIDKISTYKEFDKVIKYLSLAAQELELESELV